MCFLATDPSSLLISYLYINLHPYWLLQNDFVTIFIVKSALQINLSWIQQNIFIQHLVSVVVTINLTMGPLLYLDFFSVPQYHKYVRFVNCFYITVLLFFFKLMLQKYNVISLYLVSAPWAYDFPTAILNHNVKTTIVTCWKPLAICCFCSVS